MRVIAGSARGRRLRCFDDLRIRPTGDRVKEAVFSSLMPRLQDSRVLDLFSGSGALGIEALSRGAGAVVFVEIDRQACDLIIQNLKGCGWSPSTEIQVIRTDAVRWLDEQAETGVAFDIIVADPPYQEGFEEKIIPLISRGRLLSSDGILVLESGVRQNLPKEPDGLYLDKSKVYGDTLVSYYVKPK